MNRIRTIASKTILSRDTGFVRRRSYGNNDNNNYNGDRRLEIMLGTSCLILATACLLLAGALSAHAFFFSGTADGGTATSKTAESSSRELASNQLSSTDLKIHDAVMQQLRTASCCGNITASVTDGIVTLDGEVSEPVDRDAAAYFARTVAGVKEVSNHVTVAVPAGSSRTQPQRNPETTVARPARNQTDRNQTDRNQTKTRKKNVIPGTENTPGIMGAQAFVLQGERALDNGDYAQAMKHFALALEVDPGNARASRGQQKAKAAQAAEIAILGDRN